MNKIVLRWTLLPLVFVLLGGGFPLRAETSRPNAEKPGQAAKSPSGPAATRRDPALSAAYASADAACTTGRRRLWTEAGWVVRRVTSCR